MFYFRRMAWRKLKYTSVKECQVFYFKMTKSPGFFLYIFTSIQNIIDYFKIPLNAQSIHFSHNLNVRTKRTQCYWGPRKISQGKWHIPSTFENKFIDLFLMRLTSHDRAIQIKSNELLPFTTAGFYCKKKNMQEKLTAQSKFI